MVQRTVQFDMDFNVENLNTIGQLEDELSAINQQLKYVDVNSDAFKTLTKQAQAADGKLRTVSENLKGVTSVEAAEGVRKLGDGLVGAFAVGAGASLVFGEKTGEQLQKVIAKVGGLYAALDGIKKITEALSAQNLKFVKGAIDGFKKSAIASKLFGSVTRKALISTGIGALVVAVGLLIANFDKLKKVVKKNADAIKKALLFIAPPIWAIIKAVDFLKEKFGDLQNLIAGIGAFIKKVFTIDGTGLKGATEEFQKQVELEKELDSLRDDYNEKVTDTTKEYEQQVELLGLMEGKEQDIIDLQVKRNQEIVKNLKEQQKLKKLKEDELKALEDAEFELKKLEIRQDNLNKKNAEAAKSAAEKVKSLQEQTVEKQKQKLLDEIAEKQQTAELKRANLMQAITLNIAKIQAEINQLFVTEELALDSINTLSEAQVEKFQEQIDKLDEINKFTEDVLANDQLRDESLRKIIGKLDELQTAVLKIDPPFKNIIAYQEAVTAIGDEYRAQVDLLSELDTFIKGYTEENENGQGIVLNITQEQRKQLLILEQQKKIFEEQRTLRIAELDTLISQQNVVINTNLQYEEKLKQTIIEIDNQIKLNDVERERLEIAIESTTNELERAQLKQALLGVEEQAVALAEKRAESEVEIERTVRSTEKATATIVRADKDRDKVISEQNSGLAKQGKILAKNSIVYVNAWQKANAKVKKFLESTLQDFATNSQKFFEEGFGAELVKFGDGVSMMYDAIAQYQQSIIDNQQNLLDGVLETLDEIGDKRNELADEEQELTELMRDAEGDRYNDLKAQLDEVQAKDAALAEQEKQALIEKADIEYKIAKAQWEQAKAEKKSAIIQATIQGILATVKALPNLVLSAIVAAASAISVAAIAKQPLPPEPKKPEVAFADGGLLEGASHTQGGIPVGKTGIEVEGGEYVVNKKSTNQYKPFLDAINSKKFADGGVLSSTPNTVAQGQELIDYDRLAAAVAAQPIFASWTEGEAVGRKVTFVQSRSSI